MWFNFMKVTQNSSLMNFSNCERLYASLFCHYLVLRCIWENEKSKMLYIESKLKIVVQMERTNRPASVHFKILLKLPAESSAFCTRIVLHWNANEMRYYAIWLFILWIFMKIRISFRPILRFSGIFFFISSFIRLECDVRR